MYRMIPVNERLPLEDIEVFSGPMSIPNAIRSFHTVGSRTCHVGRTTILLRDRIKTGP